MRDEAPKRDAVTGYDHAHATTYLRLLDAHEAGATWREAVLHIFKLDPDSDPERFELMHRSHLQRAEWLRDRGYKLILNPTG